MSSKPKKSAQSESPRPKATVTKPDQMAPEVLEFIQAIDDYKRLHGRPFPNWSEVLDIVKQLGYERSETS